MFVALAKPDPSGTAFDLARRLRDEGIRVEIEQAGRSHEGAAQAGRPHRARATVILGDSMDVKDMDSGEQREASGPDEVVGLVREAFAKDAPRRRHRGDGPQAIGRDRR